LLIKITLRSLQKNAMLLLLKKQSMQMPISRSPEPGKAIVRKQIAGAGSWQVGGEGNTGRETLPALLGRVNPEGGSK
jgi:hypothetical protein